MTHAVPDKATSTDAVNAVPAGESGKESGEADALQLSAADGPAAAGGSGRDGMSGVGGALRRHRTARGLSLRKFARDLGVSASFISQLENGKSQPSVATLFAICDALEVSVDELFAQGSSDRPVTPSPEPATRDLETAADADVPAKGPRSGAVHRPSGDLVRNQVWPAGTTTTGDDTDTGPVVHSDTRRRLVLDTGVVWEQLASNRQAPGEFMMITYEPGGSSTAGGQLTRHSGHDYGYVVSGVLTVELGFETYTMHPTDSISFDSSVPHRLFNEGSEPVQAVWFVLGTEGKPGDAASL